MSSEDYATALSVYFVSYNLFEVPSNLLLKKLRPRIWLPSIVVAWAIVMTCMGVVQNKGGLYATRFLLGVTESGLFPGVVFMLSMWASQREFGRDECECEWQLTCVPFGYHSTPVTAATPDSPSSSAEQLWQEPSQAYLRMVLASSRLGFQVTLATRVGAGCE